MVLTDTLKDWTAVIRPIGYQGIRSLYIESVAGSSFPSGHTLVATAVYGNIARWLDACGKCTECETVRKSLRIFLGCIPVAIGLSRIYLGVHWPLDVIGGVTIGYSVYWLWSYYLPTEVSRSRKFALRIAGILIAAISLGNSTTDTRVVLLFIAGCMIGETFSILKAVRSVGHALLRLTLGCAGLLLIYGVSSEITGSNPYVYVLYGCWVMLAGRLYIMLNV